MIARTVRVSGRVQGVGFRWSAREEARGLGVHGWVRNTPDGGVEAHVQGSPEAVDRMVAWLRHGPAGSRVEEVEVVDAGVVGEAASFEIRV
jgi:acylphosphatase